VAAVVCLGALPALLVLILLAKAEESPAWLAARERKRTAPEPHGNAMQMLKHLPSLAYLTLVMTAFMSFSHGTQDLYPTFLKHDHGLRPGLVSLVSILGNCGAVLGGMCFGAYSERWDVGVRL
jgi:SHS family lactate transporter-like MFS transporter